MEFDKTQTFGNLARSFAGESQAGLRYQFIAQLAMKQGYKTLSDEIKYIARNETAHAKSFSIRLSKRTEIPKISIFRQATPLKATRSKTVFWRQRKPKRQK